MTEKRIYASGPFFDEGGTGPTIVGTDPLGDDSDLTYVQCTESGYQSWTFGLEQLIGYELGDVMTLHLRVGYASGTGTEDFWNQIECPITDNKEGFNSVGFFSDDSLGDGGIAFATPNNLGVYTIYDIVMPFYPHVVETEAVCVAALETGAFFNVDYAFNGNGTIPGVRFYQAYIQVGEGGPPPPPEPPDFSGCDCADDFRIEACDLRTGIVRAILNPISADWQTTLNAVGQGSMDLATKAVRARDIWPHLTSVYILRTAGGTATPENPVVEGAFMIEKFNAQDTGVTQIGMVSIEDYIYHRDLRSTYDFTDRQQTDIAATIVNTTSGPAGIPLTAVAVPSAYSVDRTYEDFDRKNIGEAVDELVASENGIEWKLEHTKSLGGAWSTVMFFEDHVGVTRPLMVQSDVEGAGYGLEVDAANHATLVDAFGAGSGGSQLIQTANDTTGIYPQFDATPAYVDIDDDTTLLAQAKGYLAENREPTAIPSLTVPSTDGGVDPALLRNGDTIERVRTNFGAVSYDGEARIISTSWSIRVDGGISRTYQFAPLSRASEAVLNQTVTDECVDCPDISPVPPPTPVEFVGVNADTGPLTELALPPGTEAGDQIVLALCAWTLGTCTDPRMTLVHTFPGQFVDIGSVWVGTEDGSGDPITLAVSSLHDVTAAAVFRNASLLDTQIAFDNTIPIATTTTTPTVTDARVAVAVAVMRTGTTPGGITHTPGDFVSVVNANQSGQVNIDIAWWSDPSAIPVSPMDGYSFGGTVDAWGIATLKVAD